MIKKLSKLILASSLFFCTISVNASAESAPENLTYSFEGESIREIGTFQNHDDEVSFNRLINPDNSYTMTITDSHGSRTQSGETDYAMFEEITTDYVNGNGLPELPATRGSEITGSQFKHKYIASSGYIKVDNALEVIAKGATGIAFAILAYNGIIVISASSLLWLDIASTVIDTVAELADDSVVDSMDVKTTSYEVVFSYDNVYYMHCYHQNIQLKDSGNHDVGAESKDYYQSIGG